MDQNNTQQPNNTVPPSSDVPPHAQNPPPNTQQDSSIYPQINITKIENPSRFYAIPILGGLVKFIILIPVFIFFYFAALFSVSLTFINSFIVLFTGRYWQFAFNINKGLLSYNLKYFFFLEGLTNKYPGFSFQINDNFSLNIDYPLNSSRIFAIPLLGGLVRLVMLIPFFIFYSVISYATVIGLIGTSFVVLITGRYPDSIFELVRDSNRLTTAYAMYFYGMSDKYPSFKISWEHKAIKIALFVIGILIMLFQMISPFKPKQNTQYQVTQLRSTQPNTTTIPKQNPNQTTNSNSNVPCYSQAGNLIPFGSTALGNNVSIKVTNVVLNPNTTGDSPNPGTQYLEVDLSITNPGTKQSPLWGGFFYLTSGGNELTEAYYTGNTCSPPGKNVKLINKTMLLGGSWLNPGINDRSLIFQITSGDKGKLNWHQDGLNSSQVLATFQLW